MLVVLCVLDQHAPLPAISSCRQPRTSRQCMAAGCWRAPVPPVPLPQPAAATHRRCRCHRPLRRHRGMNEHAWLTSDHCFRASMFCLGQRAQQASSPPPRPAPPLAHPPVAVPGGQQAPAGAPAGRGHLPERAAAGSAALPGALPAPLPRPPLHHRVPHHPRRASPHGAAHRAPADQVRRAVCRRRCCRCARLRWSGACCPPLPPSTADSRGTCCVAPQTTHRRLRFAGFFHVVARYGYLEQVSALPVPCTPHAQPRLVLCPCRRRP